MPVVTRRLPTAALLLVCALLITACGAAGSAPPPTAYRSGNTYIGAPGNFAP